MLTNSSNYRYFPFKSDSIDSNINIYKCSIQTDNVRGGSSKVVVADLKCINGHPSNAQRQSGAHDGDLKRKKLQEICDFLTIRFVSRSC